MIIELYVTAMMHPDWDIINDGEFALDEKDYNPVIPRIPKTMRAAVKQYYRTFIANPDDPATDVIDELPPTQRARIYAQLSYSGE